MKTNDITNSENSKALFSALEKKDENILTPGENHAHQQEIIETQTSDWKTLEYFDGRVAEGTFDEKDLLHGYGTLTYRDETVEKGTFEHGVLIEGTIIHADGSQLKGTFKYRQLHGEGEIFQPKGLTFKGRFENGWLKEGTIEDSEGNLWKGTFENGVLHGYGTTIQKGKKQEGRFQNGVFIQ
jgi:hypothetical protein